VTIISPNDAWAVGNFASTPQSTLDPIVQHWDGSQWSAVEAPLFDWPGSLEAVDAISARDVWAVGTETVRRSTSETRALHWDGSLWQLVATPNPGLRESFLYDVEAISSDDVWAVGGAVDEVAARVRTLVIHWDGRDWSVVPSPNQAAYNNLNGVFALSSKNVWAVGFATDNVSSPWRTLIQHWDGEQWSIIPSPSRESSNQLYDLAGTSKNDIWAVGWSYSPAHTPTLVEHWDGQNWSIVPSPSLGDVSVLRSVVALTPQDAWAVGYAREGGRDKAIMQHWDGEEWRMVEAPHVNLPSWSQLLEVAALSPTHIWTVGHTYSPGELEPLVEGYCGRVRD
jgi:hypothetical protein